MNRFSCCLSFAFHYFSALLMVHFFFVFFRTRFFCLPLSFFLYYYFLGLNELSRIMIKKEKFSDLVLLFSSITQLYIYVEMIFF